jgi:hypothetical protein
VVWSLFEGVFGYCVRDWWGQGGGGRDSLGVERKNSTVRPVIWEEYQPEFGLEDVPELQRQGLPEEIEGWIWRAWRSIWDGAGCWVWGSRVEVGGLRLWEKGWRGGGELRRFAVSSSGCRCFFLRRLVLFGVVEDGKGTGLEIGMETDENYST